MKPIAAGGTGKMPGAEPVAIAAVRAVAVRAPIAVPVKTSFGTMTDRPAVFVEVRDGDGARGLGEVWCNFPAVGAEHRARLVESVAGPALVALGTVAAEEVFDRLMARLHVLALQSGEWGPLAQAAAGLDMACHDLAARRAGRPLWAYLGGRAPVVGAYASGIGPERPGEVARAERDRGHRAFKVKLGFGTETDRRSLEAMRAAVGPGVALMADANQGWSAEQAAAMAPVLAGHGLAWLEEPIAADRPEAEWRAVAEAVGVPLAAGENLCSHAAFEAAIAAGTLGYLQPDAAKWGGVSGCLAVARRALAAGLVYCPHYLGGGIGLLASAHLLAAAGGPGLLEMDSNPNPWREAVLGPLLGIEDGRVRLPEAPGLGADLDLDRLAGMG